MKDKGKDDRGVNPSPSALAAEYQRIKEYHQLATRRTAARVVLGPSVIRVFKAGTTKDLVPVLVAIPVDELADIPDQDEYRRWFETHLDKVDEAILLRNRRNTRVGRGHKWGHATKVLNLYIREVISHSRYFADRQTSRIEEFLYMPIDSRVMRRLETLGVQLPFSKIKDIDTEVQFYGVQALLTDAAVATGVHRVWFDDNWGDPQT